MVTQEIYDKAVEVLRSLRQICIGSARRKYEYGKYGDGYGAAECVNCPFYDRGNNDNGCIILNTHPSHLKEERLSKPIEPPLFTAEDVELLEALERCNGAVRYLYIIVLPGQVYDGSFATYDLVMQQVIVVKNNADPECYFPNIKANLSLKEDRIKEEIAKVKEGAKNVSQNTD